MGKKKQSAKKSGGSRFFRWIKSDLPDEEEKKSPVLLLGVNKISESPFSRRRPLIEGATSSGSIRFFRPTKSKYSRNQQGDDRLEKIRQDLQTHKNVTDTYIPNESNVLNNFVVNERKSNAACIQLNCVNNCICDSRKSSNRGSFSFHHRADYRRSPSRPTDLFETDNDPSNSDNDIEFKYTDPSNNVPDVQPSCSKQNSYNVTPKAADRRSFLLANLNERFKKTLSLDSRKIETNRLPLSLPQEPRPKSLVNTSNVVIQPVRPIEPFVAENFTKVTQPKKKRKSFFSLETFFDKKSDSSSIDDYCSSKYKRFELESDDSPLFKRDITRERTPDLLNIPVIIDSVRKKQSDTKRQLEKLESYYNGTNKGLVSRTVIDAIPKDAQYIKGRTVTVPNEDSDVEYIEPIKSNFTSQSTLILDKNSPDFAKADSILTINTEETDIKLPSSTVSPKSNDARPHDIDSIGAYEIEVKEADLLIAQTNKLIVKVMDKSVDSIGSCSLDVDASTDFSDTTSESLNLLTPTSTNSKVRDFHRAFQERASALHPNHSSTLTPTPVVTPVRTPEAVTPTPQHKNREDFDTFNTEAHIQDAETIHTNVVKGTVKSSDNLLKPPPKVVVHDSTSQRSRGPHKKREEIIQKKPSYLNLACSVNGYTNLTTYDSKLRQDINKSREASPIRPITAYNYKESDNLVVPVPVSANKLLVVGLRPNDISLAKRTPHKAFIDYQASSPIHVFMAEENKQLKKDFLKSGMTSGITSSRHYMSSESKTFTATMINHDETDNRRETFKSSFSENSFITANGSKTETSESFSSNANGVKRVEVAKENGEVLSPMKSFIQQRVERLYGPGALAQGFFNQKRHKLKSQSELDCKVLTEKSLNHSEFSPRKLDDSNTSPAKEDLDLSLPVMRHLRPEFRAQLPMVSPKRSASTSPQKQETNIPITKTETENGSVQTNAVISDVTNGVTVIKIGDKSDHAVDKSDTLIKKSDIPIKKSEISVKKSEHSLKISDKPVNGSVNGSVKSNGCSEVKDGHYFLELKRKETERLIALAVTAEQELENLQAQDVSEEVFGFLRAAAGKARLLATQKMLQFEGLCYNNINDNTAASAFPTTEEDLQGFWDMVSLQVDNIDATFRQIAELKQNGWKELVKTPPPSKQTPTSTNVRVRRAPAPDSDRARAAAEKRELERKNMLEHRRRVAREMQLAARSATPGTSHEQQRDMGIEGGAEVEIFVGKAAKASKVAPKGDCTSTDPSIDES